MGFGLIFTGLIFFFNPCINIIDILPDFIGCIFIIRGLSKLKDVDARFEDARRFAFYLLWVSLVKCAAALYFTAYYSDMLKTLTLVFSIVELLCFFPFINGLYGGIEYYLNRATDGKLLSKVDSARVTTGIFIVARCALAFVPELISILNSNSEDGFYGQSAKYSPMITLLCLLPVLALGIYYIIVNSGFFRALSREKQLCGRLFEIYNENVLSNERLLNTRNYALTALLVLFSVLFCFDVSFDGVNILPDAISVILLFAAFFVSKDKAGAVLCVPLFLISIGNYVFKLFSAFGAAYTLSHGSQIMRRWEFVENGGAIYVSIAANIIEAAFYVILVIRIISKVNKDAEVYSKSGIFSRLACPIFLALYLLCSGIYDALLLFAAEYKALYEASGDYYFSRLCSNTETARYVFFYICIVSFIAAAVCFFKSRKRAVTLIG